MVVSGGGISCGEAICKGGFRSLFLYFLSVLAARVLGFLWSNMCWWVCSLALGSVRFLLGPIWLLILDFGLIFSEFLMPWRGEC